MFSKKTIVYMGKPLIFSGLFFCFYFFPLFLAYSQFTFVTSLRPNDVKIKIIISLIFILGLD